MTDKETVERVARAWASMDGRSELFDQCKSNHLQEETQGSYQGYMADAEELLRRAALTAAQPSVEGADFERQDWFYRDYDPDDSGDSPHEAMRHMPNFTVSMIHSYTRGPTRFVFRADTLDQENDDDETLHFESLDEAKEAAVEREATLRALAGGQADG